MTLELGVSPDGQLSWAQFGHLTVCWITGWPESYTTERHDSEDFAALMFRFATGQSLCG